MTKRHPAPPFVGALEAGRWLHNPATGEVAHVLAVDDEGRRIEVDLWLQPGAAVAGAHIHDYFVERFQVRDGEVGFQIGGDERVARPSDGTLEVPAGTVHDWWNAGDGVAHVRVEVEAAQGAPGQPGARFASMIETLWSLGALGRVNAKGMPDPLWLAAIAHRTGRDPLAPELHGPEAACAISDPGDEGLAELLARKVDARAARGHTREP